MSKNIKRALGTVSIFVLFFSLVSAGRIYAQTEELTNEEEFNLDYEYDQPVLYDYQDEKAINTNRECQCRYNNLNGYGITVIFFLFFFIQNYHLGFSVSMMKNCIQNKMWYTE